MHDAIIGPDGKAIREPGGWLKLPHTLIFPLLVSLLVAIAIAATFVVGERRGMDHVAATDPQSEQNSIAVALSNVVYHLNLGYIGYSSVLNTLNAVWDKGITSEHDANFVQNDSNRELLNAAIQAAASLSPLQPGYLSDQSLFTMYYDDLGYVDYVKWAFRLFGLKYEAMYYLFFTIVALSSLAFLVTFRQNPTALMTLFAIVFAYLIEIYVANFMPSVPTFAGMRHGSTLGLLPMWHFVFLTVYRSRLSIVNVVLAVFQLLILILAIRMRGSASWMVLFILAAALFRALQTWLRSSSRSSAQLARSLVQWPAIMLLAGFFTNSLYMNAVLHPAYFTDDAVPNHTLWHSIYLGWVSISPDLASPYVRSMMEKGADGDGVGYYAALEYLRDSHFMSSDPDTLSASSPALMSQWYPNAIKYALYDRIMRRVVLGIVENHPIKVLHILLIKNPIRVVTVMMQVFGQAPNRVWELLVILSGLALATVYTLGQHLPRVNETDAGNIATRYGAARDIAGMALLLAASVPFAAAVNMLTYAAPHTISDLLLSLLIFFQMAVWAAVVLAVMAFPRALAWAKRDAISARDLAKAIAQKRK